MRASDNRAIGAAEKIKSIQRGTIVFAGAFTATATVSSVVTSKSILTLLGWSQTGTLVPIRIELTNATTVTATLGVTSNGLNVTYQLVEYE